jgi:hypothetical protein
MNGERGTTDADDRHDNAEDFSAGERAMPSKGENSPEDCDEKHSPADHLRIRCFVHSHPPSVLETYLVTQRRDHENHGDDDHADRDDRVVRHRFLLTHRGAPMMEATVGEHVRRCDGLTDIAGRGLESERHWMSELLGACEGCMHV